MTASAPQLAKALHKPEPEAGGILETARAALRQKLLETGCTLKVSNV